MKPIFPFAGAGEAAKACWFSGGAAGSRYRTRSVWVWEVFLPSAVMCFGGLGSMEEEEG